ncbi:MAG: topoisomerase [Candidatus Saccharibacteria bacterium]|nr:topoisomerase [Candidatus Saccharibacteria bacterium]
MNYIVLLVVVLFVIVIVSGVRSRARPSEKVADVYQYSRKESVMTERETDFFHRLNSVAGDRYFVFPQIHLSALLKNQTKGRYWKAAFQRSNRTSVDYILCDKKTMKTMYAVELDDITHDTTKRRARDEGIERMLSGVGLPLVRFRNVAGLTDEEIARAFEAVAART